MAIKPQVRKIGSMPINESALSQAFKGRAEGTGYSGAGDNLLDFGKATSFINEGNAGRVFTYTIANASSSDVDVCLNPGSQAVETGSFAAADGTITTSVTGSGRPSSIAKFLNYAKHNPTRIKGIQIQVSNEAQLANPIRFKTINPFKAVDSEEERIPTNYQNPADSNTKLVEISDVEGWGVSDESQLYLTVGAGYSVTVTLVCGASFDAAKALNKKADEAAANVTIAVANQQR